MALPAVPAAMVVVEEVEEALPANRLAMRGMEVQLVLVEVEVVGAKATEMVVMVVLDKQIFFLLFPFLLMLECPVDKEVVEVEEPVRIKVVLQVQGRPVCLFLWQQWVMEQVERVPLHLLTMDMLEVQEEQEATAAEQQDCV